MGAINFFLRQSAKALIVTAGLATGAAQATVISAGDDAVFGVGSLTIDAGQGLEFLDLTLSTNRSFNDVSTQFGVGGDFAGFRYASRAEVVSLANNSGFLPSASVGANVNGNPGDQLSILSSLVGITFGNTSLNYSMGYTSDLYSSSQVYLVYLQDNIQSNMSDTVHASDQLIQFTTLTAQYYGSWLVRNAVSIPGGSIPEPASFTLLAVGLAGVAFSKRKRAS